MRSNVSTAVSQKRASGEKGMSNSYSTLGTTQRIAATKRSRHVNSDISSIEVTQRPTTSGAFTRSGLANAKLDQIGYQSMTIINNEHGSMRPVSQQNARRSRERIVSQMKQSFHKATYNQQSEENFFAKASAYGINSCEDRYSFVKEFNGLKKAKGSRSGFSSRQLLAKPI